MNKLGRATKYGFSFFCLVFLLTIFAVTQSNSLTGASPKMKQRFESEAKTMREKLELGNKASPIKVYFITNWFCEACKKVEPIIEQVYPKIQDRFGIFFIDIPTHPESENYSPYDISFQINNKSQYIATRKMLSEMANHITIPTYQDIATAAKKNGIEFKDIPYQDVRGGMSVFDETIDKYELSSTPMILVINTKTNKIIRLSGTNEITEPNILKAINEVEK